MYGHVRILNINENAAAIISSGGRISTMDGTAEEIYRRALDAGTEKNERLIEKVLSSGHSSVLEHASVNLAFENVSVLAEQFLIEFRLASFTVKSRRYVDFQNAGYVSPDGLSARAQACYDEAVQALFGVYGELCAAGVPKEDARFVLPYCFCSNFFCTMNARELVHVMNELTYGRGAAIAELRALGESLFAQCEDRAPYLAVRKPELYRRPAAALSGQPLPRGTGVRVLRAAPDAADLICEAAFLEQGLQPRPLEPEARAALLKGLLAGPRRRELEQAGFTLLFGGMSLAALTHLTRHRMQALCPPSLPEAADFSDYVLPESVEKAGLAAQYRSAFQKAGEASRALCTLGAGRDVQCYLLLSGLRVPVLTTMNAGELCVFFRLRCCTRAQWEIRACACEALFALREIEPELFSLYGPTCFQTGRCPEGRMCCGRQKEMAERFG